METIPTSYEYSCTFSLMTCANRNRDNRIILWIQFRTDAAMKSTRCPSYYCICLQLVLVGVFNVLFHEIYMDKRTCELEHVTPQQHEPQQIGGAANTLQHPDRGYISPNEILKRTAIGVKAFNRPECLAAFIASVRAHAPYLKIYVFDDSDLDVRNLFLDKQDQGDVYVVLPNDSGVGYGRNRIVQDLHRAGYEYIIMADDDVKIVSMDTIPMMAKHLLETGADLVAATLCDTSAGNCRHKKAMLVIDGERDLHVVQNVTVYPDYPESLTCWRSDVVQQFFIARTDSLLKVHWDDNLKTNDHYDFLFSAKRANISLVACSDITVVHEASCEARSIRENTYRTKKLDRWNAELAYLTKKWKLRMVYDDDGQVLHVDGDGKNGANHRVKVYEFNENSTKTRYLIDSVVGSLNSYRSGWNPIRPLYQELSQLTQSEYAPCVHLVSGTINHDLDRPKRVENRADSITFSQFMFNESCTFAEILWKMEQHGRIAHLAHVYYITVLGKDTQYLKEFVDNLAADNYHRHITVILVIVNNASVPVVNHIVAQVNLNVVVLHIGPPYARGNGLWAGFKKASELANKLGQENAIGFAIDTTVVMPQDFTARILQSTQCGFSAYAPVGFRCFTCNKGLREEDNGYWVYTNYRMIGLCLRDYLQMGGWSTAWNQDVGAEDIDMINRASKHLKYIHRVKEDGLLHVRDPPEGHIRQFYTSTNSYLRSLPPSIITQPVTNRGVIRRLLEFAARHIEGLRAVDSVVEHVGRGFHPDSKSTVYYLTVSSHHDLDDHRWVFIRSYLSPVLPSQ